MTQLIAGLMLAAGYLLLFWLLGSILPKPFQSYSIPVMCLVGFLTYFSLFQILALPMKITMQPLHRLTILWCVLMVLLLVFVALSRRKTLRLSLQQAFSSPKKVGFLVFLVVVSLGIALVLGLNTNTISDYDAGNYIGLPSGSVYSDTLDLMSPYSNTLRKAPEHFYLLNTDTLSSAVICQITKIPVLVERKFSYTIALTLLFEMILYVCGKYLFWNSIKSSSKKNPSQSTSVHTESKKKVLLFSQQMPYESVGMFFLLANLCMFYSYSLAGASHYFAYRTYEGKAITAYLFTSMIFAFCLTIYRKESGLWNWTALFLCSICGICFCNTALFVIPAMIGVTLLPHVIMDGLIRKHYGTILRYVLVLIPCLIWIVLYKIL